MPNLSTRAFDCPIGTAQSAIGIQVHLRLRDFGSGGDDTAPAVVLVSPAQGPMPSSATPVVVSISDAVFLRRVVLLLKFPASDVAGLVDQECIFNGSTANGELIGGFTDRYADGSSYDFEADTGIITLTCVRRGGWPSGNGDNSPLDLEVIAVDFDGNEC